MIEFHGHVSASVRTRLLHRSWLTVNPSQGEGWGVTVIESNSAGRPCVGLRVPGLVDSIVDGLNGWLAADVADLEHTIDRALVSLRDPRKASVHEDASLDWAARFSWDRAAARFAHLLETRLNPRLAKAFRSGVTDSSTIVELEATAGMERLRKALPASDLWRADGSRVEILVEGKDGGDSVSALEQLGLAGSARVRPARTTDLLFGLPGGEDSEGEEERRSA
jgi:hypothetical protein